jgi:DNA polymerase III subunit delta
MVALKSAQVDVFLARPDAERPIVLVYGPDVGLVRERADAIIRASVDDVNDPFALVRIEGDALAAEPARLVEEAHTVPLFGSRRAVSVRVASRHNIVPALEALLKAPSADCRIVIEAGDLRRTAPLRTLCERAKNAVAIPCFPDDERALARLIDDELRAAQLTIAPDARAALIALIGGDRLASRNEIRKLVLYAHGKGRVTMDDIDAVVGDASARGVEGVVDAAFAGRKNDFETQYAKERAAGTSPNTITSAALRHVAMLHKLRLTVEDGASIDHAIETAIPPIFFRRKDMVGAALRIWTAPRLARVMTQLAEAGLEVRRQSVLAGSIAQRALLTIAANARRKE